MGKPVPDEIRNYFVFFGPVKPAIADYVGFNVTTAKGTVEEIKVTTAGLAVQEETLKELESKFGSAQSVERQAIRNRAGVTELAITASWRRAVGNNPIYVVFIGATKSDPNQGLLLVQTQAALARANSQKLPQLPEPKL